MAIRGFNRRNTNQQLAESWQKVVRQVAGQSVADQTKVTVLRNGILQVAVANSATLGELKSFHHLQLLVQIQSEDSKIKDIKYRLNSNMKKKSA